MKIQVGRLGRKKRKKIFLIRSPFLTFKNISLEHQKERREAIEISHFGLKLHQKCAR